jgi:hypothetical protein
VIGDGRNGKVASSLRCVFRVSEEEDLYQKKLARAALRTPHELTKKSLRFTLHCILCYIEVLNTFWEISDLPFPFLNADNER